MPLRRRLSLPEWGERAVLGGGTKPGGGRWRDGGVAVAWGVGGLGAQDVGGFEEDAEFGQRGASGGLGDAEAEA